MWSAQGRQIEMEHKNGSSIREEFEISSNPLQPIYKISVFVYDSNGNKLLEKHSERIDISKTRKILSIYPQNYDLLKHQNVSLVIVDNTLYENALARKMSLAIKTNQTERLHVIDFGIDQMNTNIKLRTGTVNYYLMPKSIDIFYNDY